MIENLSFYVSAIFILTTFLTVGIFLYTIKRGAFSSTPTKILSFLIPFWLIFQAVFSLSGFYLKTDSFPPRLFIFGILPTLTVIVLLFIFARENFLRRLPLKTLTWLHIVRIPVELVLFWLFQAGMIPQLMTFEGRNFDILAGISAPLIVWLAFRKGKQNRILLIIWNSVAFLLLINVIVNAVLSLLGPFQRFAFEQPNIAVLYFPFVWLPTIIVPIVMFSHLVSFWQLLQPKIKP